MHKVLKSIKKKCDKGFTLMLVPNLSGGRVKSVAIPFMVGLLILGIIGFNIYIFIAYTVQVKEIYHFRQEIRQNNFQIARLESEQRGIKPSLKKSYQIAQELSRLKRERIKILTTWQAIKQKSGRFQPKPATLMLDSGKSDNQ